MPARLETAVHEALFWSEVLDNGGSFADYGETCTPGTSAALSGFWRGRNRADNEENKNANNQSEAAKQKRENRKRYTGED